MRLHEARVVLFVPGTRPDRIPKALSSGADAVVVDLEDAVAPAHKGEARQHAVEWLTAHPGTVAVRVNGAGTAEHTADVHALAACSALAVVVPKAESVEDLRAVADVLPGTALVPIVETATGLLTAAAVASAPAVVRLAFGSVARGLGFGGKLCIHPRQTGVVNQAFSPSAEELERSRRVVAAADASSEGVLVVDGRRVDRPVVDRARVLLERARTFARG